MAEILELIRRDDCRLLTLTGPGGVGKTRLALAIAEELQDGLVDGSQFISLASLTDPLQVLPYIARVLGVRELSGKPLPESVKDALRDKEMLLVLDNFEHVLSAGPGLSGILSSAPKVTALVTSRAALHLRGEYVIDAEPLDVPTGLGDSDWRGSAVDLFVQRALDVRPDFELSPENLEDISHVCAQLDGLPLAIELAAARIKVLPPRAMRARLDQRLPLLTEGLRDLPERQQTMQNTIAWSYELLDLEAQDVFRKLAVFTGGASLDAVSAVCDPEGVADDALFEALETLLDHHLVRRIEPDESDPRLTMLEMIREYGLELLVERGEEVWAREAHAAYFWDFAITADTSMKGTNWGLWSHRFEADHPNLRSALEWHVGRQDAGRALTMVAALTRFWEANAYLREGRDWTKRALDIEGAAELPSSGRALVCGALLTYRLGDYEAAEVEAERGLEIGQEHDHKETIGLAYSIMAGVAYDRGHFEHAEALYRQSLAVFREVGDRSEIAKTLNYIGVAAREQEDYDTALEAYREALPMARESGDPTALAYVLNGLGVVAQRTGSLDEAVVYHEEALTFRREFDHRNVALSLSNLGAAMHLQGNLERSTALYREALQLRWERGEQFGVAEAIAGLLRIAAMQDEPDKAVRLFGAVEGLRSSIGASTTSPDHQWCQRVVAEIAENLDRHDFERLYEEGRSLPIEAAISEALLVGGVPSSELRSIGEMPNAQPIVAGGRLQLERDDLFTDRELEVLRLLADGQSDREIADRLFISPRTVMKHVAHILNKCGVQTRTAAVAFAMRHGFL